LGTSKDIGIVFGVDPQLDLKIAAHFYNIVYSGNTFGMRIYPPEATVPVPGQVV
jgi:hypothetical protein